MKYHYALKQDGLIVAQVYAPTKKQAEREINHYAMMYSQDGPVVISRVKTRKPKCPKK